LSFENYRKSQSSEVSHNELIAYKVFLDSVSKPNIPFEESKEFSNLERDKIYVELVNEI